MLVTVGSVGFFLGSCFYPEAQETAQENVDALRSSLRVGATLQHGLPLAV